LFSVHPAELRKGGFEGSNFHNTAGRRLSDEAV
jgi:hypothetical protein